MAIRNRWANPARWATKHTRPDEKPAQTHDERYLGLTRQPYRTDIDRAVMCPRCHGYGKFHLSINTFGPGRHSTISCGVCFEEGWVTPEQADCYNTNGHTFQTVAAKYEGRTEVQYRQCTKCKATEIIDGS
jgi:hypothetical protein